MKGILVGCDRQQEWLLPWWWNHYSKHNCYPVAFADFGMSKAALAWCCERGLCIDLPAHPDFLKPISPADKERWEAKMGEGVCSFRPAWFKKPLACLHTPFAHTCWIDLDCEVRGSLTPLFYSLEKNEIALARDPIPQRDGNLPGEITYNSGVIVFRQDANLIQSWTEAALKMNHKFAGDQDVLSREIYLRQPKLAELSEKYNWCDWAEKEEPDADAVIVHYIASFKLKIFESMRLSPNTRSP